MLDAPAVPFYAIPVQPGGSTPDTPLLCCVQLVRKNYGQCVLAHMKKPGGRWSPWRHLFLLREIIPSPECFKPATPCPWAVSHE